MQAYEEIVIYALLELATGICWLMLEEQWESPVLGAMGEFLDGPHTGPT